MGYWYYDTNENGTVCTHPFEEPNDVEMDVIDCIVDDYSVCTSMDVQSYTNRTYTACQIVEMAKREKKNLERALYYECAEEIFEKNYDRPVQGQDYVTKYRTYIWTDEDIEDL